MIFINLYDILNSIDSTLEKNFKSYNNCVIDNFTDELKEHLENKKCLEILSKIPEGTLFTLDRIEGNYAICENRSDGKMYNIPKNLIIDTVKDGDILKFCDGKFKIEKNFTEEKNTYIDNLFNKLKK